MQDERDAGCQAFVTVAPGLVPARLLAGRAPLSWGGGVGTADRVAVVSDGLRTFDVMCRTSCPGMRAMGTTVAAVEEALNGLGSKLREARQQKHLSLQALSDRANVSAAAIHRIEQGDMMPTITTLMKIAVALNRPVAYFINEQETDDPVVLTRPDDGRALFTSKQGLELRSITGPYGQFVLAGAMATISARANSGPDPMEHPGEELIHMLEGRLRVTVSGEKFLLEAGDSLHFRTDRPHSWANPDRRRARAIWMAFRAR